MDVLLVYYVRPNNLTTARTRRLKQMTEILHSEPITYYCMPEDAN